MRARATWIRPVGDGRSLRCSRGLRWELPYPVPPRGLTRTLRTSIMVSMPDGRTKRGAKSTSWIAIVLLLAGLSPDLRAQPGHMAKAIQTCGDFSEDGRYAVEQAWAIATGFVHGLERGGVVDELLPIPPILLDSEGFRPRRERTAFLRDRLRRVCYSEQSRTIEDALDAAVTNVQKEFLEFLRLKERLRRQYSPVWPGLHPRYDPGCIPETGDGCDLFHLLRDLRS